MMHECYVDPRSNGVADLFYNQDYDVWIITRINIPRKERGKGYGTALLKMILEDADTEGAELCLTVEASDGLSNKQLIRWYHRHGFEMDQAPLWTGFVSNIPLEVGPRILHRKPQHLAPRVDVIFQADEIEFIRRNTNRCPSCSHLWLLHQPSSPSFVYCIVDSCKCTRKFNDKETRTNVHANA